MAWQKSAADRERDQRVYGSPEYRRNRELARRRANGTCEECQHRHPKLECDHIVPKSTGVVNNSLSNLKMLCSGPGSCRCHDKKTYEQRGNGRGAGRRNADPEPRPDVWW